MRPERLEAGRRLPVAHELIGQDPQLVAVRAGTSVLTYAELDEAANRLAHHLCSRGARIDTVTAIRLPRGPDLPVAILAALKAGTAYLPLDPCHPAERHLRLLRETGARMLLTTASHRLDAGIETVLVDDARIEAESATRPDVRVRPDNLIYVLPTSGTTGGSKTVAMPHRAAVNTLMHLRTAWSLGPGDVVLQLADISYSAAVRDTLGPLVNDATLELLPQTGARAVEAVAERLAAGGVTCLLSCLPHVLSALLDLGVPPCDLRLVVVISEPLSARLADRMRGSWGPQVRIVHQYGLTECAMTSLAADVPADLTSFDRVPAGHPIANTQARLLDEDLRPVPPGTVAGLYIGGAGLARGYHGQPAMTAGCFVPDPFTPGSRLYRTGDLARQLPDGTIECLGRTDRQVKIRGYRVELDEIELALQAHPALRAAAVQSHQHGGEPVVVGYMVPRDEAPDAASLAAHLARTLPEPLTALRYVALPELPTLPNGKIDRRSLPWPLPPAGTAGPAGAARDAMAAPHAVAEVWRAVLGLPELRPDDDVFAYGAHSMHVVRVAARLRRSVAPQLRVQDVFEHRSIAALAAWIAHSSQDPAPEANPRPAAAQRSLWFLDRLRPGSAAYTIAFALDVDGSLDIAALRRAVELVVRRHAALRTTFDDNGGEPRAVVHAQPRFEFTVAEVDEMAWAVRPFDLDTGPLLRVAVLPDGTRAQFAIHHTVADDWSVGVFLRDLTAAYDGTPLPPGQADSSYQPAMPPGAWLDRLRAVPPVVQLPADHPRPEVAGDRGGVVWRTLQAPLVEAVRHLADTERATPFMVLLAAWSVLLSRWCSQEDLLIGMLSAGRAAPQAEDAVGLFANTVPVPVRVDPAERFYRLLGRVRAAVLEALQHADVPFEHLVERLAPERSTAYAPLVQVACDLVDEPPASWRFATTVAHLRDIEPPVAKFDLWLSLRRRGDTMRARLEYRQDLFTRATAERIADRFEALLSSATTHPDQPVSALGIMSAAEHEQVVVTWNDTSVTGRTGSVLEQMYGHDGIAIRRGGHTLTYAQLHEASDRLAAHLRGTGLGTDDIVAICLPRAPELVVAILAVLKAGAAYLPLDPAYPAERLAGMLARAAPMALLTGRETAPAVTAPATNVVYLDTLGLPEAAVARPPAPAPGSLAYLLFTSGSTGAPKAVALTHRGVLNLVNWARQAFSRAELSCVAATTSVCFDLSVFELFMPLSSGGTIELLDDLLSLSTSPAAERVTLINTVPSAIAALLDSRPALPRLCRVNVAGEPLREDLVQRIAQTLPGRRISNLYGPTETTTYSTAADCRPGEPVSIGRPIANTQVRLLDQGLRPVPPGTVAELYIGGAGLARGYHGESAMTAERFLPDPFMPGGRLYRTGDLARQLPDGTIECLGRTDRQIKIRGHRIEPAEVEAALQAHPAVRQAVAGPYPEPSGAPRLVAWVVTDGAASGADLRAFLGSRLPGFLVPSVITLIDTVPLNLNGKVDWAALPPPQPGGQGGPPPQPVRQGGPPPALTVAEQEVARLWQELLGVEHLDVESHFFQLGAHSLTATRLISQVNERFGIELPVSAVFASPRLREFAQVVEDAVLRDIIERRRHEQGGS
jgi:amino acid adenylation domain-containing protein